MSQTRNLKLLATVPAEGGLPSYGTSVGYSTSTELGVVVTGIGGTSFLSTIISPKSSTDYKLQYVIGPDNISVDGIPLKSEDDNVPTTVITIIQF